MEKENPELNFPNKSFLLTIIIIIIILDRHPSQV